MNFVRLESADDEMFSQARALYLKSFPLHEQREEASQREILGDSDYRFALIYDGEIFVGLLLCWEAPSFIYVEHFCVDPQLRNRRYGERALALLGERGKTVILEIDPPVEEMSIRRRGFYERAGFRENSFAHVHPPYHQGYSGHALTVMSYPKALSQVEYDSFCQYLQSRVMGC